MRSRWLSLVFAVSLAVVRRAVCEEVCVEGYLMDQYCIDRGTLVNNQELATLEHPDRHSYHCLLDITLCTSSGYEVLLDPPAGQTTYCRAFRLDSAGQEMALALGRSTGQCDTCTGGPGSPDHGFRATIKGTVTDYGSASSPGRIAVSSVEPSQVGCALPYEPEFCVTESGRNKVFVTVHGSLMIAAWGVLLPAGAVFSRLLRHRPNGLWFKLHVACQVSGLLVALVGFIIALSRFHVFEAYGHGAFYHGCMGATTMTLGLLQPLNALVRPHAPEQGEKRSLKRLVWEIVHKSFGYVAIFLAVGTSVLGTFIVPNKDRNAFQSAYAGAVGGCLGVIILALLVDKALYNRGRDDVDAVSKVDPAPHQES